ncbi:hypothetical protein [Symbioplanes lichenis]|uniref:hypothetical protein n=1 Tax=Symbioplanes lichenis TaxID=1629072 RepID=UPI00273928D9|nr:hypothetical protein [Actinoplanes lichenis]
MRRYANAALAGILIALAPGAAAQAAPPTGGGWVKEPTPPFDFPAGVPCDFAVHGEPIVDEVYYKDISETTQLAVGPLIYEVSNPATGASTRADASSSAVLIHRADGSQTWLLHGPLLLRFREGNGNLPRGLYNLTGPAWRLDISSEGRLTVSGNYRITKDVCATLQP